MRSLYMLGFLAGCALPVSEFGPVTTGTTAADTGGTAPVTTGTLTTTSTGTTAAATTTAATTPTTIDTTASSSGASFLADPDTGGSGGCDVYIQDCPPGQKCAWTAPEDAGWWETTTCVPLAPAPLPDGAPCTYDLDAVFDSVDECGPAAMCVEGYFEPGEWDGQATCMSLCKGSGEYPYCDPGMVCVGGRSLYLCIPTCDPFIQDCPVGQRCDFYGAATLCTWDWPDEPRIEVGEPCDVPAQCELGATCIGAAAATPACAESSCCTPFCNLANPQAKCPLPGQKCLAPDDWGQPVQPSLGVCRTETP
jgi:hypothetical protein